jgi:hypothetical protein
MELSDKELSLLKEMCDEYILSFPDVDVIEMSEKLQNEWNRRNEL